MSAAIIVENLSKSYLLKHRLGHAPAYQTLRESIARGVNRVGQRLFSGRRIDVGNGEEVFWALRNVNFAIEPGERVAIIGRNGAGKSTLLKLLSRITAPSEGSIRILGRLSSLLEVGTGFHPELTGRENILLSGAVHGMSKAEVRLKFDEIVAFSEVERFLDTPVKRFSSGMYVRLAFAVSAFLEPDIILLDEVLAVGDAAFQRKCQAKMRALAAEGRTVVFVSHSMSAVKAMCSSGIVLAAGAASEKLPVDEAISRYIGAGARSEDLKFPVETDEVDLLAVDLMQDGAHAHDLDGAGPIDVVIRVRLHIFLTEFRVGFYLKTTLGDAIVRCLAADWHPESANLEAGEYTFRARIPSNFLVAGNFVFELHCSRFGIRDYFGDSISIPIRVRPSNSYNQLYPAEEPFGLVHLNPEWHFHRN